MTVERAPRPAATLVVVRDADVGIEVLLLQRAERGDHNSSAWVFPGGTVDEGDCACHTCCGPLDDAAASQCLGLSSGGLDYYVAAIRECFEEAGLLFAHGADPQSLAAWRTPLLQRKRDFGELCRSASLTLQADALVYLSHWVTPLGRPKRFDTRFFIAAVPPGQDASHDGTELVDHRWLRAADALAQEGALKLMTPTKKTLEAIARFDSVAALLAWASSPRDMSVTMPHVGIGKDGPRPVLPDEPAFAELRHLDPAGHGTACYDIQPGVAVRLSPRVIRVTANNGSVMTGPGTNTYLVGGGPNNEWAVIDPGPLDASHVNAVLAAAPGPIRWILATHTHTDHSPACTLLKARTGAPVHGRVASHPEWQDATFAPDVPLAGGERIVLHPEATLHAIHTPGHASNHLCYLLEEEKTLFTGDHVMQQSTVVINPPDGDMAAYIASLRALLGEDLLWLAPGHGFLMPQPKRAIEWIIAHRGKREAKVIDAVRDLGPADIEALLAQVYDDVPQRMHGVATRSLKAHLYKLRDEGTACEIEGRWLLREA